MWQRARGNDDFSPHWDLVVEVDDISHPHANAAVASRLAEAVLFGGAVNVDVASKGMAVLAFEAPQPEDAGDNRIAARRIGGQDLAVPLAALQNGPGRQAVANFGDDFMPAKGGAATAGFVANTEFGGGDGVLLHQVAVLVVAELLFLHGDDDFGLGGAGALAEKHRCGSTTK